VADDIRALVKSRSNFQITKTALRRCLFLTAAAALLPTRAIADTGPEVVVVGAGVAGLSAAIEAADRGARVLVFEAASLFGGHAVMSSGDVAIPATPEQERLGIKDSPDIMLHDLQTWGEDPDPFWSKRFAQESLVDVYEWLVNMGVSFDLGQKRKPPGNSVPRLLATKGRGMGLVAPIFVRAARHPGIKFFWNMRVTGLMTEKGRVVGVKAVGERNRKTVEQRASAVVLATGGFQSDLERVRRAWPSGLPVPETILVGSGLNSMGEGLDLAQKVGGVVSGLDHQWNYVSGIPDPAHPEGKRGISMRLASAIWVNANGQRFVNEKAAMNAAMDAVVRQPHAAAWAIFDDRGKRDFFVAGTGWEKFETFEARVLANPLLTITATTLKELATRTGLPPTELQATVSRFNGFVANKKDLDFGTVPGGPARVPPRVLDTPPFYAIRIYPLSRKSMGGVVIDHDTRVVDEHGQAIAGLYAAGELTGVARINGKAALEGTFLAPSILTGRVAGRALMADLGSSEQVAGLPNVDTFVADAPAVKTPRPIAACQTCHPLSVMITLKRPGYWHFEAVHRRVLENKFVCDTCHQEVSATAGPKHRFDRVAQTRNCHHCHQAAD
jgi:uncharacterized protein